MKHLLQTGYKAIDQILEHAEPHINNLVGLYKDFHQKNNLDWTERDEEYTRVEVIFDLVKALSNYLLKTDEVTSISFKYNHGRILISCVIDRDGEESYFTTESIVAKGDIQVTHLRYIVKSKFRKVASTSALDKIKAERSKMTKEDKIKEDIQRNLDVIERYKIKKEEMDNTSDEEVLRKHNDFFYERFGTGPKWEYLSDNAKKVYESEEKYMTYMRDKEIEHLNSFRHNAKVNLVRIKELEKRNQKLETKLKNL